MPASPLRRLSRTQAVAASAALLFVVVVVAIVVRLPDGALPPRFIGSEGAATDDTAVLVTVRVDSFDAARATMRLRIDVVPGPALPASGALVISDVGAMPAVKVVRGGFEVERTVDVDATAGDVVEYPFDRYRVSFRLAALADASQPYESGVAREKVRLDVVAGSSAAGFAIDGELETVDGVTIVTTKVQRSKDVRIWSIGMMAIYWMLGLAALAVGISVIRGYRSWETGFLTWMGAMLFALTAFRNAAPGSPPIGTFFDFNAYFPATAIVAITLMGLIINYLVRSREELGRSRDRGTPTEPPMLPSCTPRAVDRE